MAVKAGEIYGIGQNVIDILGIDRIEGTKCIKEDDGKNYLGIDLLKIIELDNIILSMKQAGDRRIKKRYIWGF